MTGLPATVPAGLAQLTVPPNAGPERRLLHAPHETYVTCVSAAVATCFCISKKKPSQQIALGRHAVSVEARLLLSCVPK
jgi:hypothetical protein